MTVSLADSEKVSSLNPHLNPPDEVLKQLLIDAKTIAMVGASSDPNKESNKIMRRLLAAGYHVVPVNPRETEVLGKKAFASLDAIGEPVDIVDVFRRSEDTPPIADEAAKIGAKTIWLQVGVSNEETAERARAAGLTVVMNKCIGATHDALRVPPKSSR
jgi:predicted CoA-binding protein